MIIFNLKKMMFFGNFSLLTPKSQDVNRERVLLEYTRITEK